MQSSISSKLGFQRKSGPAMHAFAYSNSPYPIRSDLKESYRDAWRQLADPGTWWSGRDRVAIAEEVRNAQACELCASRKAALSPFEDIAGDHLATGELAPPVVDAVHRLTTDPSRLTQSWLERATDKDFTSGHYVEIISIVVTTLCIDTFHRSLGFDLEPLPEPRHGKPSGYVPDGLNDHTGWVPMIGVAGAAEQDLWPGAKMVPNVIKALSSVPDAVRLLKTMSAAQYVPMADVPNPSAGSDRAISRAQIEFIAARVSAINDCFY